MSTPTTSSKVTFAQSLSTRRRKRVLGLTSDDAIRYFFAGNAWTAIIVLAAITFALFREGAGFFPQHLQNLRIYREAGLEFVDIARSEHDQLASFTRAINLIGQDLDKDLHKKGVDDAGRQAVLAPLVTYSQALEDCGKELDDWINTEGAVATGLKDRVQSAQDMRDAKAMLLKAGKKTDADDIVVEEINIPQEVSALTAAIPQFHDLNQRYTDKLRATLATSPAIDDPAVAKKMQKLNQQLEAYMTTFPQTEVKMTAWRADAPIPFYHSLTSFLFGTQWVTQSFWQDWYGVLPLFSGSLLISLTALAIAVPFGVGAAIYVNQFAYPWEQTFIKPYIEFISAIPSVVLGFFGILILGESIRLLSEQSWLAWIPFFPISERLNAFTAAVLLALMAIPTIFTLAEDAINNVPRHFKEAAFSLGATRLQTTIKIIVPAALSGIIAAILLGFGRVIGETMVVLLLAGNRIQIPDFTQGLGVIFQPVHTMTGLIAQEVPEVVKGSLQYRALFMVGILLFFISLLVNWLSQLIIKRYKISIG